MENRLTTGASIPIFSEFQRRCRPARTNSVQIPKTTDVEFAQWQVNRYSFPYRSRGNFWLTVPSRISGETGQNERNGSRENGEQTEGPEARRYRADFLSYPSRHAFWWLGRENRPV